MTQQNFTPETNRQNRILWIDIAKGICMIWIVMSHINPPELFIQIYTPFFLTTFFFVSGYTFSGRSSAKDYIQHKIKTILVPYWCFGIINALLAHIADGDNLLERFTGLLLSISGRNDDLWFVMCLFSMQIIFYLIWRFVICNRKLSTTYQLLCGAIISVIIMILGYGHIASSRPSLPFQLETAFVMIPFMLMGYCFRYNNSGMKLGLGGIAVCLTMYLGLTIGFKNIVNIHAELYPNFPLFIVSAILGTILIAFISINIETIARRAAITKLLIFIGQNTFVYYAFQSKAIRLLNVAWMHINLDISEYIKNPLSAAACCAILAIPAIVVNRRFPFLLGKHQSARHIAYCSPLSRQNVERE